MLTQERTAYSSEYDGYLYQDLSVRDLRYYYTAKRGIDVILSIVLIVFLSPIFLLAAICIFLDNPGSIVYRQERVSTKRVTAGGRIYWKPYLFTCYKFRTMFENADTSIHKKYVTALIKDDQKTLADIQGEDCELRKIQADDRVTRVGRFLRKCSIDELPQFVNVIRGDMSLVGPRPPIPYEVAEYKSWHMQRLKTKPGITGLWQVSARSTSDFDDIVRMDISYIENQSIWLDLFIILKTPFVVILCKGAV